MSPARVAFIQVKWASVLGNDLPPIKLTSQALTAQSLAPIERRARGARIIDGAGRLEDGIRSGVGLGRWR